MNNVQRLFTRSQLEAIAAALADTSEGLPIPEWPTGIGSVTPSQKARTAVKIGGPFLKFIRSPVTRPAKMRPE